MDREKAAKLRLRICHLLDQCGNCPKRFARNNESPAHRCGGCKLYAEIRGEGRKLAALEEKPKVGNPKRFELDEEIYFRYHAEKMQDKDIAKLLGVHSTTIAAWKKRNGIRTRNKPASDEEVIKAYRAGWGTRRIREELHCGEPRVYRILKEHGIR